VPIEILASPQEKANPLLSSRKTFSTRRRRIQLARKPSPSTTAMPNRFHRSAHGANRTPSRGL